MTTEEKERITQMRLEGVAIAKIAIDLSISVNTIKSYCRRSGLSVGASKSDSIVVEKKDSTRCKQCGKRIRQNSKHKPKRFCSDICRLKWWNNHREELNRKLAISSICKYCHKSFQNYSWEKRKYCSHSCYIRNRFGGEGDHDSRAI